MEDERGRPGDAGVEHDVAGVVETDGIAATITVTAVGDTATAKTRRLRTTCVDGWRRISSLDPKLATNLFRGNRNARRNGHIWQTSLSFPVRDGASLRERAPARRGTLRALVVVTNFLLERRQVSAHRAVDKSFLKVQVQSR